MICATPTGSTAYAFSAGGPVVWPEVEALLLVPICAHALFAGPMVIAPASTLAVEVIGGSARTPVALPGQGVNTRRGRGEVTGAVLWCDGRRRVELPPGSRVEVRRGARPVLLASLNRNDTDIGAGAGAGAPFTDRLVAKFELPVTGWRGSKLPVRQAPRTAAGPQGRARTGRARTGRRRNGGAGQAAGYGQVPIKTGNCGVGPGGWLRAGSDQDGTVASAQAAGYGAGSDQDGTVASAQEAGYGAGPIKTELWRRPRRLATGQVPIKRRRREPMLEEVRITGLGVINDVVPEPAPGLTVVTGETGAGKTMVVTGLGLLFGGRGDPARVRPGADRATVEGRLRIDPGGHVADQVGEAGGELDDGGQSLVVSRSVSAEGRSRAYGGRRCRCHCSPTWPTSWWPCTARPTSSSCSSQAGSAPRWTGTRATSWPPYWPSTSGPSTGTVR